jgi:cysteine desulfurase/selenocysteine lyase
VEYEIAVSNSSLCPQQDFPLLERRTIEGRKINYLDSSATTLKPQVVIDAVTNFYTHSCGNIHRGDHTLSREASELFEDARHIAARFIGATSREVSFTSGTTDGLNRIAEGLELQSDENVIVSLLDHHSNILPWMGRCEVRFLPVGEDGCTDVSALADQIDSKTRLVSLGHVSNVTGAICDVAEAGRIARSKGVPLCIDGAQSVPHFPVDVLDLECDFLVFSGHKMCGPSGVGVLYIKEDLGPQFRIARLGGGTPDFVRVDGFDLKELPYRLEPGTPNIEGVIGLGAAMEYLENVGMENVEVHDRNLTELMYRLFDGREHFRMIGPRDPSKKIAIASLVPFRDAVTVASVGNYLSDSKKIMARSGTHCAHPYFDSIGVAGSLRLSTYVYSSEQDIVDASEALDQILR